MGRCDINARRQSVQSLTSDEGELNALHFSTSVPRYLDVSTKYPPVDSNKEIDSVRLRLLVHPQQCPEAIPVLGVTVEIDHGVEHAGLQCLLSLLEYPHDGPPTDRGEY